MFGLREADDCRPVTWLGRMPVYLTTVLVAIYSFTFFVTTFATAYAGPLVFNARRFWAGAIWEPLTYTFVQTLDFFSALSLLFFYLLGVQVEMYLGRRRFLALYAALILVPAVFLALFDLSGSAFLLGTFLISTGFFVAFATLYPNVEPFGFIAMKWLALILNLLSAMTYVQSRNWMGLAAFLVVCALAFAYVRSLQLGGIAAVLHSVRAKVTPKPKVVLPFRKVRQKSRELIDDDDVIGSIDPLLEKISKHGLDSLTPAEKGKLERARLALLKKG